MIFGFGANGKWSLLPSALGTFLCKLKSKYAVRTFSSTSPSQILIRHLLQARKWSLVIRSSSGQSAPLLFGVVPVTEEALAEEVHDADGAVLAAAEEQDDRDQAAAQQGRGD